MGCNDQNIWTTFFSPFSEEYLKVKEKFYKDRFSRLVFVFLNIGIGMHVFYVCIEFDPDFVTSIMLLEFSIEIVLSVLIHSTSIPFSLACHK